MVNWEFFDNQTPSSARDLVDSLRTGEPPVPTRGASLCSFRETARTLAGLPDPRPVTNPGDVGAATLAGLRIAHERGMSAPDAPTATTSRATPDDTKAATEATKDERAPAPSADVPPKPSTPETEPSATDSDK
jgi:NADH-quinone oxidoreductase subunit E